MSVVIHFPTSATIEINAGVVTSSHWIDEAGRHPITENVGKRLYFVDVVEHDGGRMGMWSGADHASARSEAIALAKEFAGRIVDHSGDAA